MRDDIHRTAPVPRPWRLLLKACKSPAEVQSGRAEQAAVRVLRWEEARLREGTLLASLKKVEQNVEGWLPGMKGEEIERHRVLSLNPSQELCLSLVKSGLPLAKAEVAAMAETSQAHFRNIEAHLLAKKVRPAEVRRVMGSISVAIEQAMPRRHASPPITRSFDMDQGLPLGNAAHQRQPQVNRD